MLSGKNIRRAHPPRKDPHFMGTKYSSNFNLQFNIVKTAQRRLTAKPVHEFVIRGNLVRDHHPLPDPSHHGNLEEHIQVTQWGHCQHLHLPHIYLVIYRLDMLPDPSGFRVFVKGEDCRWVEMFGQWYVFQRRFSVNVDPQTQQRLLPYQGARRA